MSNEKLSQDATILHEEEMMERGRFIANGFIFHVKPIYLGEEDEYLSEMKVSPVPNSDSNEEATDKELGGWAIALFSRTINGKKKYNKIIEFFIRLIFGKNYRYYDNYPAIQPMIKWIERKVTYKGKKIRFYDLERKYELSKADIEKLFVFLHQISGF